MTLFEPCSNCLLFLWLHILSRKMGHLSKAHIPYSADYATVEELLDLVHICLSIFLLLLSCFMVVSLC